MRPKIGIVGGSGFIGSSLAKHFAKDFQVIVLDVKRIPEYLEGKVDYAYCDIRDYKEVAKMLKDVILVIHMAIVQIPLINECKKLGYEVNIIGTQNVCKVVNENQRIKGMILAGTWHTIGEKELSGVVNEEFGFRPDKVEDRARLYALSKMAQEAIVRFYDEMSEKIYGIIRTGTVLGEGMPKKTAANIFIEQGLKGKAITPYKHSMHRPMLYVDINDLCKAYEIYARKILSEEIEKSENSLTHIVNVYYPKPITIFELAEIVRNAFLKYTDGKVWPEIKIVDTGAPLLFMKRDKNLIKVDISKAKEFLGLKKLKSPREAIEEIVKLRLRQRESKLSNSPPSKNW